MLAMNRRMEEMAEALRANGATLAAGLVLLGLAGFAARWIVSSRGAPSPRKVSELRIVNVQPQPQPKVTPPVPPPPTVQPKIVQEAERTRVDINPREIPPPDISKPSPSNSPGGGRLSLAAEGEGPGDAFNLAGKPGGRGILTGGGLGDGTGDGLGDGEGTGNRFGWYYAKIATEIENAFRKQKRMSTASARVEIRIWTDEGGRISRVQLVKSTGDPDLDEAIRSIVGLRLREPPPADIPMPMVARFTARRPG